MKRKITQPPQASPSSTSSSSSEKTINIDEFEQLNPIQMFKTMTNGMRANNRSQQKR
jgi:hypothetical protein